MATDKTQALLFDLGGVVIDIDFDRAFACWQPISRLSLSDLRAAFKFDAPYQQHERGEITATEYFAHLCRTLQLQDDRDCIEEGWNAIFAGEISETRRMLEIARARYPCYAFTNSNDTHQAAWSARFPEVVKSFERIFVSSRIGYRKPERRAFEYIGHALGIPLKSIMFFDDLPENVEGAATAGLNAVLVREPADIKTALTTLGCIL
ncbi:MAG: HAD-IA family hydrolase [Betaproteobacteria bacterium]|nr:HAD-IA family hydrolase [Betaproteobacteria bacterium]